MERSIHKMLTRGVIILSIILVIYIIFRISSYFLFSTSISRYLKIDDQIKVFNSINTRIMEMESIFLNYQLGIIPTQNRILHLMAENENAFQEYSRYAPQSTAAFSNLHQNHTDLQKRIRSLLSVHPIPHVALKDIGDAFISCRMLCESIDRELSVSASKSIRHLRSVQKYNIVIVGLLVASCLILIGYFNLLRYLIFEKISRLNAHIRSSFWIDSPVDANYPHDDEFKSIFETFNMITAKVKIQHNRLKQSEKRFKSLFDNHPYTLVILNENRVCTSCNRAALKLFGCGNFAEFRGRYENLTFTRRSAPDSSPIDISLHISRALKTGFDTFECWLKSSETEPIQAHIILNRITMREENCILGTLRDITEIRKVQERRVQAQKMETIGTLAGGLAHDFNNVLSGIGGSVTLLNHKMKKKQLTDVQLSRYLAIIEMSSNRAQKIVANLLMLSSKQITSSKVFDIQRAIDNMVEIVEGAFDRSIVINRHPFKSQPMTTGDPHQMEQVFMNFLINASHALTIMKPKGTPWGGEIDIVIEHVRWNPVFGRSYPQAESGDYWLVSFKDNGVGMDQKTKEQIFNPFFTTKSKGVGTGLGLSMAFNIIRQHNGFIDVYSEPGAGTSFNIFLPAADDPEMETTGSEYPEIPQPPCDARILIIDDDPIMREIATDILTTCGYDVITSNDAHDGITRYKEEKDSIHLSILDLIMPGMSGRKTFDRLKNINPDVRVLLASGYKNDHRIKETLDAGAADFITKPYTLHKLGYKVAEILLLQQK